MRLFEDEKGRRYSYDQIQRIIDMQEDDNSADLDVSDYIEIMDLKEIEIDDEFIEGEMASTLFLYRNNARITQEQLARGIGINQNAYSRYETGARQMPYDLFKKALEFMGYEIQIVKKEDK